MPRFIDSSVILRYLTRDDPRRSPTAKSIIESDDLLLSCVILQEVAYVLRRAYGIDRRAIIDTLAEFVQRENVDLVDVAKESLVVALAKARQSAKLSLGDAFILAQMQAVRRHEIYSFDTRFRDEGITVLEKPAS